MGARLRLTVFWCEKCQKRVCEALPKAMVWCGCGRRAKPIGAAQQAEGGRKPQRGKASEDKGGTVQVQVGLPI